jgi:dienelactone hydrolase
MSAAFSPRAELVSFASGGLALRGYLYRPIGGGRRPAMIFNHGSERAQDRREHLAEFYSANGLVLFLPHRRGHGASPGTYEIGDMRTRLLANLAHRTASQRPGLAAPAGVPSPSQHGGESREQLIAEVVRIHERALRDTIAAAVWLQRQGFVDRAHTFMSGASHGGIQALLAAEADVGMRAYVAFAPGAMGWKGNPELHERLAAAVAQARAPIMLAQAANDFDLGPTELLGAQLRRKGGRNCTVLYPAYGATREDGHGGFACQGSDMWGADVLRFLH